MDIPASVLDGGFVVSVGLAGDAAAAAVLDAIVPAGAVDAALALPEVDVALPVVAGVLDAAGSLDAFASGFGPPASDEDWIAAGL